MVVKGEDWAQMHETHAAKSCAWVFELAAKFEVFAYSRQTPAQQRGMRQHMQQKAAVVWICFILNLRLKQSVECVKGLHGQVLPTRRESTAAGAPTV